MTSAGEEPEPVDQPAVDSARGTPLYDRFLPPPPFRGIDHRLFALRFAADTGPDLNETLRAWEAAEAACPERQAAHAMHFAEEHLRSLAPELMARYDEQRGAGAAPALAMAAARAELQEPALPAFGEDLGVEASEQGLARRDRRDRIDQRLAYGATAPSGPVAADAGPDHIPRLASPAALVDHPAPVDHQLTALLAAGDYAGLCEFAEALGNRRDQLCAREQELVVQETEVAALVGPPSQPGAGVVPAAAVAARLAALVVETGDDVGTLGIALAIEPAWVRGVLSGEISEIDAEHVQSMCAALESTPEELFGPAAGLGIGEHLEVLAPPAATGSVRQLVDTAGFLRAGELMSEVDAIGPEGRADLVCALATRHSQLESWAEDLAAREALAAARLQVPSAWRPDAVGAADRPLPAAAAAAQIEVLALDSGEDLDTLASGLGLEPAWVREVVAGSVEVIDANHARRLCDALELSPAAVFGVAGLALEGPDTGWAVVPYDPFDHEMHVEFIEPAPPAIDLDFGP